MAGKPKLDPAKTQAEEIAQLKAEYLTYYRELPHQKLAAGFIGRSPDTIQNWMKDDEEFSAACSRAKADWARNKAKSRQVRPEFLLERILKEEFSPRQEFTGKDGGPLELGIASIVREASQSQQLPPHPEEQQDQDGRAA